MAKNNEDVIELKTPLLFLLGLTILIAVIAFPLLYINQQRRDGIYKAYAKETNGYIRRNQKGLIIIFNSLMTKNDCTARTCSPIKQEDVIKHIDTNLKDFSSTMFIRIHRFENIQFLRLSGDQGQLYIQEDKKADVIDLLHGKRDQVPWEDYIWEFQGKEIIIPVKDEKGITIGAIVRGVIEK